MSEAALRAVLLGAGRGSRLGSITSVRPKCLTPLGGKALLDWQLEALRGAGISRFGVVRGYLGQLVDRPGLETVENTRWGETNMVRSLQCAAHWLRESACLVSYTDIIYTSRDARRLAETSEDLAIAYDPRWQELWSRRFPDPRVDAESFRIDESGYVVDIGRKIESLNEAQGQYVGLLKISSKGWGVIEAHLLNMPPRQIDTLDMTSLLRALIAGGVPVRGIPLEDRWLEVDSETDLRLYESWMAKCAHPSLEAVRTELERT